MTPNENDIIFLCFVFMCSAHAIQQKAALLTSQCNELLQKAKQLLHTVSLSHSKHKHALCFFAVLSVEIR